MRKQNIFLAILFLALGSAASAQSYIGHTVDNFSGVHGIISNPANVVDSNFRTDINLFSASVFAGSDYFGIDLTTAFEGTDGFQFEDDVQRFPKKDNQFFLNVDVLGPSFMFNINAKSSIGITTRARAFMNLNNIDGRLYENMENDFDEDTNFNFELDDFSGTVHSWGEIGLTYGHILMQQESHFLKGGVTLKYLQGAGANFVNSPALSGDYDAETGIITTSGSLTYGSSNDFDTDNIEYSNLTSGFGADIGFVYEYRPQNSLADIFEEASSSDYKFKLGISLTDLGSIKYSGSTVTSYDMDQTLTKERWENEDLETILEEDYEGTEQITDSKINLPSALHLLVDYRFRNRLFVAVQGSLSLVEEGTGQANRIINTVTAVPRYESKWFSFYLPVGVRQYDGFTMGAGFRLGPLSIGSGSVVSNYISDAAKTTDFYVGLKVPVYR